MADPIADFDDPCARATALRRAYYTLVSGEKASEIEYQGNGVARRVRYSQTDLNRLFNEIKIAETQCAVVQGTPPSRVRSIVFSPSKGV